jgi:hypothetical protein
MGKRALGFCLFLLSTALWLGPILWGLSAYNWNFMDVVTPEAGALTKLLEKKPAMRIVDVNPVAREITLGFENLPLQLKVEDFSCEVLCTAHNLYLGSAEMKEQEVLLRPPSDNLVLSVSLENPTYENHLLHLDIREDFRNVHIKIHGISISSEKITSEVGL